VQACRLPDADFVVVDVIDTVIVVVVDWAVVVDAEGVFVLAVAAVAVVVALDSSLYCWKRVIQAAETGIKIVVDGFGGFVAALS